MRHSILALAVLTLLAFFGSGGCAADADPLETSLVVLEAGPAAPLAVGDTCTMRMQPAWRSGVNCQVLVRCEGADVDLFGGRRIGGYAVCETTDHRFTTATDDDPRDGDPAIALDLEAERLTWRDARPGQTLTLAFAGERRSIEPWDEHTR